MPMLNKYLSGEPSPLDRSQPVWGLLASFVWLVVILFVFINIQMLIVSLLITREHGLVPLEEFKQAGNRLSI